MDNVSLSNITTLNQNSYFIVIEPHISHHVLLDLNKIQFQQHYESNYTQYTSRFIHANTDSKFFNSQNQISIKHSTFYGSVSILYIDQGIFDVNIHNIIIQTPQYFKMYHQNILYMNAIHIGAHSKLSLTNIHYETITKCDEMIGNEQPEFSCLYEDILALFWFFFLNKNVSVS